jgi:hypothetical protein
MAVKTFTSEILTSSDTNTYLANSGLTYVTSASLNSGTTTVAIGSAFNTNHDAYRIVVTNGTMSNLSAIALSLTGATTGYYGALIFTNSTGAYTSLVANNAASGTYSGVGTTTYIQLGMDIYDPFLAKPTRFCGAYMSQTDFGNVNYFQSSATSYTGFTLTAATNFTGGTVTVYGYRKP